MQDYLYALQSVGRMLGPSLSILAADQKSHQSDVQVNAYGDFHLADPEMTVGEFFRLDNKSARQLFDSDMEALILSHCFGAKLVGAINPSVEDPSVEIIVCGRCASSNHGKMFGWCIQVYIDGQLMKGGVCTNCLKHGDHQVCSFRSKSPTVLQTLTSLFPVSLLTCSSRDSSGKARPQVHCSR